MNRASIVTIIDGGNYGNRLQNYATQCILETYGFSVKTLVFTPRAVITKRIIKDCIRRVTGYDVVRCGADERKSMLSRLTGYTLSRGKTDIIAVKKRYAAFTRFNKSHLKSKRIARIGDIDLSTDYFVVGSDQVWNVDSYYKGSMQKDMFLLTFARPQQKLCMAPSFGNDTLPEEWKPFFRQHLASFPHLAVREETGVALIKELTGRDAMKMIDPTLLLPESKWLKLAKKPAHIDCDCPYVLSLFLGEVSEAQNAYMAQIAAERQMTIYRLNDSTCPDLFSAAPDEFIYILQHAQLVLTDSFHACVFSFLLEKPFLVFERQDECCMKMFSRIQNLLSMFSLERKKYNSGYANDLFEHDYGVGKAQLQLEREKADAFLRESMQIPASQPRE